MITLKEIAEICHVSTATVSNVLNGKAKAGEETKKKIMEVIRETGYRPNALAKGLRTKKTQFIAVIVEDLGQFSSPPIISGITERFEKEGYQVVLYNMRMYGRWSDTWYDRIELWHKELDPIMRTVYASNSCGVIYLAGHARNIPCSNWTPPLPVVLTYAYSNHPDIPSIVIDDTAAARELTAYLIGKGHKRIGFLGGREDNLHTSLRLGGYQEALREAGIAYDPAFVTFGNWERASGRDGAEILCKKGVTAVFVNSDRMAGGVYDYLEETGKQVGKDLSIAGFDNDTIASYFRPALTTTELPLIQIGQTSAEILLRQMQEGIRTAESPEVFRIPCVFKERSSVSEIS